MKKKLLYILLLITFFSIFAEVVSAEELSNKSWWIYDHTDNDALLEVSNDTKKFIEKRIGRQYGFGSFNENRHIEILDSGKVLKFTGYPDYPYADMLFYPSTSKETKTFEFSIKKNADVKN